MRGTFIKFGIFAVVMALLTGVPVRHLRPSTEPVRRTAIRRCSPTRRGSKTGDTVRVAGIRVGTVQDVSLQPDRKVLVKFDADRDIVLTAGTKAADPLSQPGRRSLPRTRRRPGSTKILPAGSQIPVDRTAPALDLDLLLGGLKPVIQGLNPQDVNALTGIADADPAGPGRHHRIAVLQDVVVLECVGGQQPGDRAAHRRPQHGRCTRSPRTATSSPARSTTSSSWSAGCRRTAIRSARPSRRSTTEPPRWPTCSIEARPPLAGTVDQLNRLAPLLDADKASLDATLQRRARATTANWRGSAPTARSSPTTSAESTFRASDLQGRTVGVPVDQARDGEVRGDLMLKYRGSNLIRAGFIGVVLIILVIAVGLQPERLISSGRPSLRYQALFTEGRRPGRRQRRDGVGHQGRLGHRRSNSRTAMRWSVSPSTASTRSARRPPRTSAPERCSASGCWPWSPAGSGTLRPSRRHPDHPHVVAVLVDRRGQ